MAEKFVELPDVCWELIFRLFNHHRHLEAPSIVCKRFLSITNSLRRSLTVADPTVLVLTRLFKRFPHLKQIDLHDFQGDLNVIVHQIVLSGLDLEELNISNRRNLPVESLSELGSNMKIEGVEMLKALLARQRLERDSEFITVA
ncbi:hypothetical protein L1049_004979 [Liquidambar formosana]|uniref:F-box domain-containing protein n=1 Tax=Liquidambar formosana TaxID=63359 RepID=A0AAP0WX90_LIQFO